MAWVAVFHLSLLVHDHTSGGIGRAFAQKISHAAIELIAIGKPIIESFLTCFLAVATANEYNFHRHHLLQSVTTQKKTRARLGFDKNKTIPFISRG